MPANSIRYKVLETYDDVVKMLYFLAHAGDEVDDKPRAACYLRAVVDSGQTFMRLMQAEATALAWQLRSLGLNVF